MGRKRGAELHPETPEEKTCAVCGRRIEWRRKWADSWAEIRYCSAACRGRRNEDTTTLETAILDLLGQRRAGATICPSDVARAQVEERWRDLMEPVREAARRLAARDVVRITQSGHPVDPSTAKGPIRIARGPHMDQDTQQVP